jgi:hypothetical protein
MLSASETMRAVDFREKHSHQPETFENPNRSAVAWMSRRGCALLAVVVVPRTSRADTAASSAAIDTSSLFNSSIFFLSGWRDFWQRL